MLQPFLQNFLKTFLPQREDPGGRALDIKPKNAKNCNLSASAIQKGIELHP